MKNTLETRLGLFFAMALLAAIIILEMVGGRELFRSGPTIRARFNNALELRAGDPVKMAGVEIGRVTKVKLAGGGVEISMKISREAEVRTDSKATIRFVGLMGQNFVAIDFGSPKAALVEPDALLASQEQADLNSLMSKLDNVASGVEGLTKNFSGESFGNLFGPFTDFLKENNPKLSAILGNVQNISGQIAQGKGTVGRLIQEDTLYNSAIDTVSNLNASTSEIKPLIEQAKMTLSGAQDVLNDVKAGKGTVGKLVKDETLYRETTAAMTDLHSILGKINKGDGTVGKLINEDSFLKDAKMTLQKVDKATEGIEDQGALSVFGILVQQLF